MLLLFEPDSYWLRWFRILRKQTGSATVSVFECNGLETTGNLIIARNFLDYNHIPATTEK